MELVQSIPGKHHERCLPCSSVLSLHQAWWGHLRCEGQEIQLLGPDTGLSLLMRCCEQPTLGGF